MTLLAHTIKAAGMASSMASRGDGASDSSSSSDPLDTANDEGWEDLENDEESVSILSLFDERTFPNAQSMLAHCRGNHGFDIWKLRQDFGEYLKIFRSGILLTIVRN